MGSTSYYGAVQWTPYKWLNIRALCETIFPEHTLGRVRYFTARISSPPEDPQKGLRQQVFIRALETLPNLSVHYGHFAEHRVYRRLVHPLHDGTTTVLVYDPEEKGSDVSLASYLLVDGFRGEYEIAIVVSNDSDLAEPIRLVHSVLSLPVDVLSPQWERPTPFGIYEPRHSKLLQKEASRFCVVKEKVLAACQLPPILRDSIGTITKPAGW